MKIQKVIDHKKRRLSKAEKEKIEEGIEKSIKRHKKEMKRINRKKKKKRDRLKNPENYWNRLLR